MPLRLTRWLCLLQIEGVRVQATGLFLAIVYPGAFVELHSDQLSTITAFQQLRIYCAGIWHNMIICGLGVLMIAALPREWKQICRLRFAIPCKSSSVSHYTPPLLFTAWPSPRMYSYLSPGLPRAVSMLSHPAYAILGAGTRPLPTLCSAAIALVLRGPGCGYYQRASRLRSVWQSFRQGCCYKHR